MNVSLYLVLTIAVIAYSVYSFSQPEPKENLVVDSLKERLAVVDSNFRDLDIRESDSSYTEDKSVIYLCLRDGNHQVYPTNTVMYVALHEIAHLLNKKDYGHTPTFYKVFNDLLCKAAAKGVYDPTLPHGDAYCGVDIRGITMPKCKI
jgi:hypothetical protein